MKNRNIIKRKIVVTGGTRGIGRIIVEGLYSENELFVISMNKQSLLQFHKNFPSILCYQADVSDFNNISKVFKKIGKFDILINCAGILCPVGDFVDNDLDVWYKTISVNLLGTVNCCKAAIPYLKKKDCKTKTKIINIAGGGAAYSRTKHTAYACSKTAVVRFTEILAAEFKENNNNIDVNVIAPGAHKTDMWKQETADKEPENWSDSKRLIETIKFFSSEKSNNITGRFIHILDKWEQLKPNVSETDLFTLRRIDDWKFTKINNKK